MSDARGEQDDAGVKKNGDHGLVSITSVAVKEVAKTLAAKSVEITKKDVVAKFSSEKVNGSSPPSLELIPNGNSTNDDEKKAKENGSSHSSMDKKDSSSTSPKKLYDSRDEEMSEEDVDGGDESSDSVVEIDAEESEPANGQFQSEKRTTNIVMVDDMKTLKSLANTAKKLEEATLAAAGKSGSVLESSLLAGKSTSGVTITPAKPRVLPLGGTLLGSGVTISPSSGKPMSRGVGLPVGTTMTSVTSNSGSGNSASMNTAFTYDKQGQLNDPNLTDDTFVVEAPSFIVPYVYEKPPKETFQEFKDSVKKLTGKDDEKTSDLEKPDKDGVKAKSEDKEKANEKPDTLTDDKADEKPIETPDVKKAVGPGELFFGSALGKFITNLGMNLVQEHVQHDLLRDQTRRAQKDKSATVMHAVMSLKKNLESSRDKNEGFHFEMRKCRLCSYRTESLLSLENHIEVPHLKNGFYKCYFCSHETKNGQDIITHMALQHGVRARFDRPLVAHQCPQCPFEDSMRGKLTRHKVSCDKRFRSERNQEPPHDWEPPAKISKPAAINRMNRPNLLGGMGMGTSMAASMGLANLSNRPGLTSMNSGFTGLNPNFQNHLRSSFSNLPQLQFGPRGRGRPVGSYKPGFQPGFRAIPPGIGGGGASLVNRTSTFGSNLTGSSATMGQGARFPGVNSSAALLNSLGANPSLTIQSISQRNQSSRPGQPSISITPLAARAGAACVKPTPNLQQTPPGGLKPGQPAGAGKRDFVICEICDGYIKDLEQLRNHMQWIHKVKIHPKMIYNRPPLNCQKCQFRFFTDQGLERHLLGSHGLVTASMQDLANKNQDSGRCPVCGKVYQWKLLNHVSKDHHKILKPAHLSYKCTVCTATFGQYKLFETHVYTAHSVNKKGNNGQAGQATNSSKVASLKVSDEITITPQGKPPQTSGTSIIRNPLSKQEFPKGLSITKKPTPQEEDIAELDDDEEQHLANKRLSTATLTKVEPSPKKAKVESDIESDEGVEEIIDDD